MIGFYAAGAMGSGGGSGGSYFDAVMADSPALYLRFAEAVSGGPNNSGSASISSPSYNAATRGQLTLCGDDGDYSVAVSPGAGVRGPTISHSSSASLYKPNDFTIEAIIYPLSVSGQHAVCSTSAIDAAELRIISAGLTLIRRNAAVVATSTTNIPINTRSHIACRIAADGTYTFFLNGSPDGTGSGYAAFAPAPSTFIGYEDISGSAFNGRIDEWAYYTSALSDARIAAHAAAMT